MTKAFIFLNGTFPEDDKFYKKLNIDSNHFYCADGGAKKAIELNIIPKEVWGDFDSLDETNLQILKEKNVIIKKFNKDKDFTDGELLISYVSSLNYNEIIIIGGFGGRMDHTLTNINLVFKYPNIVFVSELEKLFVINNNFKIKNKIGKTISFIPFSDTVEELTLNGFLYPLKNHTLKRGDSTCISNIVTSESANIEFKDGKLIATISLD